MIDCASKTIKKEGVRGLYKGMSAPIAGKSCFSISEDTKKLPCKTSFFSCTGSFTIAKSFHNKKNFVIIQFY